jgi:LmbE family N-acetylglucosaminyl deacetylase
MQQAEIINQFEVDSHWFSPKIPKRTLLVVYAHPDDETFGNAGTLSRYAAQGVDVHYICGTRGESGVIAPQYLNGYKDAAELRTAELLCAAQTLGLRSVHFLGYRDSGMEGAPENKHPQALYNADLNKLTGQVVAIMRQVRPQVVITFGEYGGYGHPDHIMMHKAALAAFHAAGDPNRYTDAGEVWHVDKLYYSVVNPALLKIGVPLLRLLRKDPTKFGENQDVDLVKARDALTPTTTVVDCADYLETRDKAILCHRSQAGDVERMSKIPMAIRRQLLGKEGYTRAIPPWTPGAPKETDLFDGIGG